MSMMLRMAGTLGQRRMSPLHPMTRDYIARLQAVSGHEPAFDAANDYLIRELVNLGGAYWDTMGTMTTLVGKKWEGLLVPLRDGMDVGTNVNFVSGDFNAKTGLLCDGNKKINSNRNNNADPQNSQSMGFWRTTSGSIGVGVGFIGVGGGGTAGSSGILQVTNNQTAFRSRQTGGGGVAFIGWELGYSGVNRATAENYSYRVSGESFTVTEASQTPHNSPIGVFQRMTSNEFSGSTATGHRFSLYHIGPALDLATLDSILTEYMARIDEVAS